MKKSLKRILVTGASLLMLASAGAGISQVNANADGTAGNTTWYNTPRLTARHMREIKSVKFNSQVAGGEGSYIVKLRNGEIIYGTPSSPFGRQLRRYRGHRSYRHGRRHYRRHAVKRHRRRATKRHARRHAKRHARRHARRHGRRSHRRY